LFLTNCHAPVYNSNGKRYANTSALAEHTVIAETPWEAELREITKKAVKRSYFATPPVAKLIHFDLDDSGLDPPAR
jgi:hypothetical protein